jgi:tetratricopeptide (TPR) repeat protein
MTRAALLAIALAATTAHANVWRHAIETGTPDPAQDVYDSELKSGDELAVQANSHGASPATVRQLVQHAATSYRNAAAAKPGEPEAYYRLGRLLYSFYFECSDSMMQSMNMSPLCINDPTVFDRKRAEEVIDAWDAFEQRAPLDPRLSVHLGESEVLFHRAILNTKLATKDHLNAAARDYEKILARSDTGDDAGGETVWSNLAETYMMLDRLDDSIDTYREALRRGAQTATLYGLAVALDRDERSAQAKDLILSQGAESMEQFLQSVARGHTFFVPRGEEYYYYALAHESFNRPDEAIEYWDKYIRSGAHPEFQPRAKAHLDALRAQQRRRAIPIEAPWHRLIP